MAISIAEAQRLGLIPKTEKQPAESKAYVHPLTKRLTPICKKHGWQVDVYRTLCTLPESPQNTAQTVAAMNGVVVWRIGRVEHLGWIWDVNKWTDEQAVTRLEELA